MSELQSADMVEKLKDNFDEMVVYKDLKKSNFITSFKMPSFMRDWVLKRFQLQLLFVSLFRKKRTGNLSRTVLSTIRSR